MLTRWIIYPALYWIGFAVVWVCSLGRAGILPFSHLGEEDDAPWWAFRVRYQDAKLWRAESMIIIGAWTLLLGVTSGYVVRYLL